MKFFHLGPATSSEYSFKLLARFMNHETRGFTVLVAVVMVVEAAEEEAETSVGC
ncbi:hypothetical protein Hanom_Chr06g00523011 [Helianthus anomalus]